VPGRPRLEAAPGDGRDKKGAQLVHTGARLFEMRDQNTNNPRHKEMAQKLNVRLWGKFLGEKHGRTCAQRVQTEQSVSTRLRPGKGKCRGWRHSHTFVASNGSEVVLNTRTLDRRQGLVPAVSEWRATECGGRGRGSRLRVKVENLTISTEGGGTGGNPDNIPQGRGL